MNGVDVDECQDICAERETKVLSACPGEVFGTERWKWKQRLKDPPNQLPKYSSASTTLAAGALVSLSAYTPRIQNPSSAVISIPTRLLNRLAPSDLFQYKHGKSWALVCLSESRKIKILVIPKRSTPAILRRDSRAPEREQTECPLKPSSQMIDGHRSNPPSQECVSPNIPQVLQ